MLRFTDTGDVAVPMRDLATGAIVGIQYRAARGKAFWTAPWSAAHESALVGRVAELDREGIDVAMVSEGLADTLAARLAFSVLANIQALADAGVRFVAVSQGLDVKPDGDAMSRLMLTVLAAVAEFERDLIRERTHLGLARARSAGKRLGRPPVPGPSPDAVRALRREGKSWSVIAAELGCTIGVARLRSRSSGKEAGR